MSKKCMQMIYVVLLMCVCVCMRFIRYIMWLNGASHLNSGASLPLACTEFFHNLLQYIKLF